MIDGLLDAISGVFASLLPDSFAGFAWPWMLLALPLPLLLRWLLPPVADQASGALRVPFGDRLDAIAGRSGSARVGGVGVLAWLAWALLCVAAARPQTLGPLLQPPQEGRELMLAVDVSGSMSEEDMQLGNRVVDRLTAAKAVLADFLDRRAGDRVGLIVFGQRAFVLAPLTLDRDTVRQQLQDSVVGLAGRETAIGDAIGLAVKRLRAKSGDQASNSADATSDIQPGSAQGPSPHVLILLTDGVNTAGQLSPEKATELARDEGIRIHTIAFGGYGGGMSIFGMPLRVQGGDEMTDEAGLKRIADATGGRAFRARDTDELAGIYAEIDRLEPIKRPGKRVQPRIERYHLPLAAALGLALLGWAWPRRGRA